jgi:signal transduction histidine kinase
MKALSLFRRSLAARLGLVYGLTSVLMVAVLGLSVYWMADRYLLDQAMDDLHALADFYAAYTTTIATDQVRLIALAPDITGYFAPQADYDVRLFDAHNGALLAASQDLGRLPSSVALAELRYRRPTLFVAANQDLPDRIYAARSVTAIDDTALAVVEVSRDLSELRGFLGVLRLVLVGAGGLALVVALVASLLLARQMTHPLRQVESATRSIASGDLSQRLAITSADEIGRLAGSVNRMAADLSRLEAARREFIARISHDLRTPLTAIKGLVVNLQDVAPDEMQPSLATMDEQAERLIRLVNDLLALSRLQRGELKLRRAEVDLTSVARSAVSLVVEKARNLGVALSLDLPEELPTVSGDADRLQQVVVNLLDNALKATAVGGDVQVQVRATEQAVILTVVDNGRGLTAEEAVHAFEPYFRGIGGGAGLGLTIAREIVRAHGGRIWLEPRPDRGAEAAFALPLPSRRPSETRP